MPVDHQTWKAGLGFQWWVIWPSCFCVWENLHPAPLPPGQPAHTAWLREVQAPWTLDLGPWERSSLTCMELGTFGPRATWILLLRVKPPRNIICGWKTKKIHLYTGFQKSLIFQGVAEMGLVCSSPPRVLPPPLPDTGVWKLTCTFGSTRELAATVLYQRSNLPGTRTFEKTKGYFKISAVMSCSLFLSRPVSKPDVGKQDLPTPVLFT